MRAQHTQTKPWYRYGWPWFLMSFPALAVVLGFHLLYLAMNTNNSLVVGDYYRQGKGINQRIERDRIASRLGVTAQLTGVQEGVIVQLSFRDDPNDVNTTGASDIAVNPEGSDSANATPLDLALVHVTLDTKDIFTELQPIGNHRYLAKGVQLPSEGRWRIHLQPQVSQTQIVEASDGWRLVSPVVTFLPGGTLRITAIRADQQGITMNSTLNTVSLL